EVYNHSGKTPAERLKTKSNKVIYVINMDTRLAVFEGKNIRKTWHLEEWWFVLEDIIIALTSSTNPKDYLTKMRERDESLSKGRGQIVSTLLVQTKGGKQSMNCTNTEGAFRIIQSIPSQKAEPFKLWLAKTGYERIQEIENPEIAQNRAKEYYVQKGYLKDWIDKRLRGVAVRQELNDEWNARDVGQEKEFAILTNEISKATFGKTVQEYKKIKGLDKKNQNLRDHMNDWEIILTMVGEKAITDITKSKDSKGFDKCKESANEGGSIAKDTRKAIEKKTGKPIVSEDNFLQLAKTKKLTVAQKMDKTKQLKD
ncbi:MAG: BRO family protein, partial [archaeon]